MNIRPETSADYAAITAVNISAFGERTAEALMVAALRLSPAFDPALSLVAEVDGCVVAHALFVPYTVRLLGQSVRAVNLAPIAVDPAHQRRGLGGALIEAGHANARAKGCAFSFLLGHISYYPRFGYRPRAFGNSSITLSAADWPATELLARRPRHADVSALQALWSLAEGAVDFALEPGGELLDWLSPNPSVESLVFTEGEAVVGYLRAPAAELNRPRVFLARDVQAAQKMAAHCARAAQASEVALPLHPASAASVDTDTPHTEAWDAAMVCPFTASVYDEYEAQMRANARPPGRPFWPTAFDFDFD